MRVVPFRLKAHIGGMSERICSRCELSFEEKQQERPDGCSGDSGCPFGPKRDHELNLPEMSYEDSFGYKS